MAAPMDVELIPNEYYELKEVADINSHPCRVLADYKIVMVAETSEDSVVFKWPCFGSLAFFFNDCLDVLPTLDQGCTLKQFEASSIVKCQIDLVRLCFYRAWLPQTWVHDNAMVYLRMCSIGLTAAHNDYVKRNRVRTDHFYALSYVDLPSDTAVALALRGSLRVAWVSRQTEGPNVGHRTVEVRVPSMASLGKFEGSESLPLPDFNQVFSITSESASRCLQRILPLQLCFQMRKRRDFWIIEPQGETSGAGAGVRRRGRFLIIEHQEETSGSGAGAGVDAHDADAGAGVSGADH